MGHMQGEVELDWPLRRRREVNINTE